MRQLLWLGVMHCGLALGLAAENKPLYETDFSQAEAGKPPDGMLILDGGFAVREEGGNKFLELPGAPLETYGALFGPTESENLAVSLRCQGSGKGRRFPTFGVGLNGVAGYRLQVSPGKKELELFKGDIDKASVPFEWQSGKWTRLKLQVRKLKDGGWKIEGKAWSEGAPEPTAWGIAVDDPEAPKPGRASLWGCPFAETPIRYDDLAVRRLE